MTQNLPGGQSPFNQLQTGYLLVNRYLIQEVVGVGGMGSVYRARDLHFPNIVKLVAVKEMINQAPDKLVRETIVQNFEREANILATLNHPSIPKIFDYFSHDERSYLVLEYVNGKDLEALLLENQTFFPEDQVVSWAIEICDVLQYLHDHKPEPIIFRDMKPSNIMINQSGHVMLVDFGIAKMFRSGQKGTMIGTEGYSPPEQYRGEATPRADLYALGASLHHLLTRHDPRLEAPFSFPERPIRKTNATVSAELESVIMNSLNYNPDQRYPSAQAMKDALMAAAHKTGILPRVNVLKSHTEQVVKPVWTFRCEDEIRGAPAYDNGILYVGSYDNNLYALQAIDGKFLWKFPTQGGIVARPTVVQNQVIFGSEDHRLYGLSSRTGLPLWQFASGAPIRSAPSVYEGHIFFGSDDGILYAVNLDTTHAIWKFDAGSPIRSSPAIAGNLIYFGTEAGDMYCLDPRGQIKWRVQAKRSVTSSPFVSDNTLFVGSQDSTLYAIDARSGWVIWRFRMSKGTVSSPYRHENMVLIGSADSFLYAVDANNARELWRFQGEHQFSGSPVVYKDSVYCGGADGVMYCLELRNGHLRWKFTTEAPITSRPLVANEILYFGSADHMVYALTP